MFGALSTVEGAPPDVLAEVAREFSPRIEVCSHTEITLDLSGLTRLFGDARTIAEELRRTAADRGLRVRVAIAGTRTAARLLVRHRAGLTIVEPGNEAAALAPLPLALLGRCSRSSNPELPNARTPERSRTTRRSRSDRHLPPLGSAHARRSGGTAVRRSRGAAWAGRRDWQRLARGEDPAPLVPAVPEERFEQALDLEWPIEGLEPLSFVLGRLMEPLAAHLERRDRGAAVLHVRLHLVKTMARRARCTSGRCSCRRRCATRARCARWRCSISNRIRPPAAIDRVVGGRRSHAGAHRAVLAADASAAVAGAGLHADGAAQCADGRRRAAARRSPSTRGSPGRLR